MRARPRRRLGLVLLTAALALAGLVAAAALAPLAPPPPRATVAGVLPAAVERLREATPDLPPLEALSETVERPLFLATRTAAPADGAATAGSSILGRYEFVGVALTPARRLVLLRPSGGGPVRRLREGDQLDGWTVERITADELRLRSRERTERIPLGRSPE